MIPAIAPVSDLVLSLVPTNGEQFLSPSLHASPVEATTAAIQVILL